MSNLQRAQGRSQAPAPASAVLVVARKCQISGSNERVFTGGSSPGLLGGPSQPPFEPVIAIERGRIPLLLELPGSDSVSVDNKAN